MTLAPRFPKQKPKTFSTYDLEWYPGEMKFRMAGVYDPERGYRCYSTMQRFLVEELTSDNYGRTFFAHNAGRSDMHFVLHELMASGLARPGGPYFVEAMFNGSSAFLVHVCRRGDPRKRFIFSDTLFLLKASLKKIGEWLGFHKGEVDFNTEDWNLLRDYNERDNLVLYKAIIDLEAELVEMGGEFKSTLASCAMTLFQCRYLKHTLKTNKAINKWSRFAYYASRVEVFNKVCREGKYFDVNSSFPWSMKQTLPGDYLKTTKRLSEKPAGAACYIAEATVTVPETFLPPLPYRDPDGRILFPVGTWRATFTQVDLELLEQCGGTVEKIHQVDWYAPFYDLGDYVDDLYAKKNAAEGFKRELYKLLLNALYGKFAEGEEKEKVLLAPGDDQFVCEHSKGGSICPTCFQMRQPGFWIRKEEVDLAHVHVPIPAFVTSYSRRLLYNFMEPCEELYYCDTDSITCGPNDNLPTGPNVGELKHEYDIRDGHFAAPKLYSFEDRAAGKRVVRSKGFSRLDYESYQKIIRGEPTIIRRMVGLKENLRNERLTPTESDFVKRALMLQTKRKEFPDGTTRPWTMEEIKSWAA